MSCDVFTSHGHQSYGIPIDIIELPKRGTSRKGFVPLLTKLIRSWVTCVTPQASDVFDQQLQPLAKVAERLGFERSLRLLKHGDRVLHRLL